MEVAPTGGPNPGNAAEGAEAAPLDDAVAPPPVANAALPAVAQPPLQQLPGDQDPGPAEEEDESDGSSLLDEEEDRVVEVGSGWTDAHDDLWDFAETGDAALVERLLDGATLDLNVACYSASDDVVGLGAYLCWAADQEAAASVLRVLLAFGLDPCRGGALRHAVARGRNSLLEMLCRHAEDKSEAWTAQGTSVPAAPKEQPMHVLARRAAEVGEALGKAVELGRLAAASRLLDLLRRLSAAAQLAGPQAAGLAASTADSLAVSLLYGARQALCRATRGKGPAGAAARKRELAPLLEALAARLPPAWAPRPGSLLAVFAELGNPPADLALCLAPWAPGLHARCATPAFKAAARELCRAASGRVLAGGGAPPGPSLLPALPQEVVHRVMELAARPWSEWVERDAQCSAAEVGAPA